MKRFKGCEKTALSKTAVKQGLRLESWGFPQANSTRMLCYFSLSVAMIAIDRQTEGLSVFDTTCSLRDLQVQFYDLWQANSLAVVQAEGKLHQRNARTKLPHSASAQVQSGSKANPCLPELLTWCGGKQHVITINEEDFFCSKEGPCTSLHCLAYKK